MSAKTKPHAEYILAVRFMLGRPQIISTGKINGRKYCVVGHVPTLRETEEAAKAIEGYQGKTKYLPR